MLSPEEVAKRVEFGDEAVGAAAAGERQAAKCHGKPEVADGIHAAPAIDSNAKTAVVGDSANSLDPDCIAVAVELDDKRVVAAGAG